ncbi:protein Mis18-beta [Bombina bombina]|uniref:protein Mis18-beta n=1 Tax=Bombina bombina TaxID=8345 RepID=UPI00235A70FA|nr:protein Mis18-beta [Bombina bombina]
MDKANLPVPEQHGCLRPEDCAVFMCRNCYSVLGDSLSVCTEEQSLGVLACLRVTDDVNVGESLLFGKDGVLKGCAYHPLQCRTCGSSIGFNMYSAFRTYAYLRGLFCIFKDSVSCYLLKSKMMTSGHELRFELSSLQGHIKQLKEDLVKMHSRLQYLLVQLEQPTDVLLTNHGMNSK